MIYKALTITGIISISLLTGCFGAKPEAELYVAFENAMKQEKMVSEDVKKLEVLEKEGQELYNQIINEGKDSSQAIMPKLEQATKSIDEREKVWNKEKEAFGKAQEEVKLVHKNIDKMEDAALQKQAKNIQDIYKKRYASFSKINDSYQKLMKSERELYKSLGEKETNLKKVSEKIKDINQMNEEIQREKESFNEYTKEYNKEKLAFYKQAKIKIKDEK
ncbi:YkyA family protein [Bacillus mycoides]|uniref:YkyA family protein n=1 Tax=Bacillus cereus group sp. N34 TaxID=2794595 RepID=UPI000995513B|nr:MULTISPECIES: YkyA family protein [Bacillus cereus group]MBJ8017145.1 YkyA family protein [Bacillus cereus group sp. N34]